jgi:hypothetical protein
VRNKIANPIMKLGDWFEFRFHTDLKKDCTIFCIWGGKIAEKLWKIAIKIEKFEPHDL